MAIRNREVIILHYSERIRNLREDRDLKQSDIAAILYVAQKTYSDYELGRIRIPIDSMLVLAKFYNVSMDYISGASNKKSEYPTS